LGEEFWEYSTSAIIIHKKGYQTLLYPKSKDEEDMRSTEMFSVLRHIFEVKAVKRLIITAAKIRRLEI